MARTTIVTALVAVGLTAVACQLNPTAEQHRARIRAAVVSDNPLIGRLGYGAYTAFKANYHSVGIASITTSGDHLLSIGALGMVYVNEDPQAQ
jgi:lipopolysaccharide export LptBFGC system permease protein LptF